MAVDVFLSGLGGALLGALLAIWSQQRENRKASAFELMQVIDAKLSLVRATPLAGAQEAILRYYGTDGAELEHSAARYLDYLCALDFFLFAADAGFINAKHARMWLRDLLADEVTEPFVTKLRALTGNGGSLEYLAQHFSRRRRKLIQFGGHRRAINPGNRP